MRCHASTLQQPHNRFVNVGIRFDIFKQGVVAVEDNSFNIHEFLLHVYCYASKYFIMIKELNISIIFRICSHASHLFLCKLQINNVR